MMFPALVIAAGANSCRPHSAARNQQENRLLINTATGNPPRRHVLKSHVDRVQMASHKEWTLEEEVAEA